MQDDSFLIQQYFEGQLSKEEQQRFEERIQQEENFKQEVELFANLTLVFQAKKDVQQQEYNDTSRESYEQKIKRLYDILPNSQRQVDFSAVSKSSNLHILTPKEASNHTHQLTFQFQKSLNRPIRLKIYDNQNALCYDEKLFPPINTHTIDLIANPTFHIGWYYWKIQSPSYGEGTGTFYIEKDLIGDL